MVVLTLSRRPRPPRGLVETQIPGPRPESLIPWAWVGPEKVQVQAVSQVMLMGWCGEAPTWRSRAPRSCAPWNHCWGESRVQSPGQSLRC